MTLTTVHEKYNATLAADGIPLQYGDLRAEYDAALHSAILLDRSHEGRIQLSGSDRHELLNRMSTNKIAGMQAGEGRPTIFTNSTARIIDRIMVYDRGDDLLLITEPGRGEVMTAFLQRHIFFNDDAQLQNITTDTAQFALHGPRADAIMQSLHPETTDIVPLGNITFELNGMTIFAARRKPLTGEHWIIVVNTENAAATYEAIVATGNDHNLTPGGSLTYNTLRIRAGRPAGRELSTDYLPLEVGLWDEVHFDKGCYTGQEIIARMESRARLAKTIVALRMDEFVEAPASIEHEGTTIGTLTSSAQAPDGDIFAIGIVKTKYIEPGTEVTIGDQDISASIARLLGEQPTFLTESTE